MEIQKGLGKVTALELINTKSTDFSFADNRGKLTQLVHEGFDQVNVLITNEGVTRGGHYHKISFEAFYIISGSVEVTAKKDGYEKKYVFRENDFFEISPYVIHSMFFPEHCVMVQMYDKCVEKSDGSKDIYSE